MEAKHSWIENRAVRKPLRSVYSLVKASSTSWLTTMCLLLDKPVELNRKKMAMNLVDILVDSNLAIHLTNYPNSDLKFR